MKFRINATGHAVTTTAGKEVVEEKDFWAMLKRQVVSFQKTPSLGMSCFLNKKDQQNA